jgi:DNA-binding transcriptional regulator YhcF (GntR family)
MDPRQNERDLIEHLLEAINSLPDAHAELNEVETQVIERHRLDAIIEAEIAGQPLVLLVEAKQNAFPRDVREAVWQLRNHQIHYGHRDEEVVPFVVSNAVSTGARDVLKSEGVGYADSGGSLFIPAHGAFVLIDRPPPSSARKTFEGIFQGSKARVLETVFAERDEWLSVKDVADDADVSPATASATLSEMERREWMEVRGRGPAKLRRLSDPKRMIDSWSQFVEHQKPPSVERYYSPLLDWREVMKALDHACHERGIPYAITGEAAAQAYAPFMTSISQVRCRMVPSGNQRAVLAAIDARPVDEGWNLAIVPVRNEAEARAANRISGVGYASPLRAYLDLLQLPGRAKDVARHLRAERLGA